MSDTTIVDRLVPYTFEESMANWADLLDGDADDAELDGGRRSVRLTARQARSIARHLRGAARRLEQEGGR